MHFIQICLQHSSFSLRQNFRSLKDFGSLSSATISWDAYQYSPFSIHHSVFAIQSLGRPDFGRIHQRLTTDYADEPEEVNNLLNPFCDFTIPLRNLAIPLRNLATPLRILATPLRILATQLRDLPNQAHNSTIPAKKSQKHQPELINHSQNS